MERRKRGGQLGCANGNWRGGGKKGICGYCGAEFTAPAWEMKHRQYCSRSCSDKAKIKPNTHRTRPHVHVMEKILGVRLPQGAVVHHINGNRIDNRPENLLLCKNQSEHIKIHAATRIKKAGGNPEKDKICSRCKQVKPKTDFHIAKRADGYRCYCKACQSSIYQERRAIHGNSNQISIQRG